MKALITGITGFVGSYLAEYLLDNGFEVFGTTRPRSRSENIEHIVNKLNLIEAELSDPVATDSIFDFVEPDYIFHLAAQSFVPTSWKSPTDTITNNVVSQINLFESIRKRNISPRVQIAGSSEEYGLVYPNELPISEDNPLRPLSPYAVSKISQDLMAFQYFRSYGLDVVRTRAFNHEGPRRGEIFVTSNFARQLALIEAGKQLPVIKVGNLKAQRDFSDVRDIVVAYKLALDAGESGEVYNLCSEKAVAIEDMLNILIKLSGQKVSIEEDPSRMRPSDVMILKGSSKKFKILTNWQPKYTLEQTLSDLLQYWRKRVN